MLNQKSNESNLWKYWLMLPVLAGLFFTFSCNKALEDEGNKSGEMKVMEITEQPDEMAQFPGGQNELASYLMDKVTYPEKAKEDGTEGTVYVSFVISKTGKVENVEVQQGVSESLDEAALKLINTMPDWVPGEKDGQPVNIQLTLPIKFQMD